MSKKLCVLSVDLDPLTAYYEIHGLGDPPRQVQHTIMKNALPRFEELLNEWDIKATFFVVGKELNRLEETQIQLKRMAENGHEIANHTYNHPYNLNQLSENAIEEEIRLAHQAVIDIIGDDYAPVGFRAPGYFMGSKLCKVLENLSYRYDSSMFPSPPYYMAKAAVMGGMLMRGRRSGAVLADPRGLSAPIDPYRPDVDTPWNKGSSALIELPVAVMAGSRLPAIGTLLAIAPEWLRKKIILSMAKRPFFNLELHGIDLSDAVADRVPTELAGRQPDLRVPYEEKRKRFTRCMNDLKEHFEFVTMKEAAERLADGL